MAIYSIDGTSINIAHAIDGTEIASAYDVNGTEIFSDSSEKYSIDNVVSYFKTDTLAVASALNELSSDWQSFVFITDQHGSGNKNHSQAIGLYLLDNTPVSMIVLGGDYSLNTWSETEYDAYMLPFVNSNMIDKIYAIMGNHEVIGGHTSDAKQCIYNDFLADKTNIIGVPAENYYYFDKRAKKTRYMFLNTSDAGSQTTMTASQIAWIEENVILPSSEWSLVVFGHVSLNNMGGITNSNESNGSSIISAIKNCNGTIVGYICGHQHIDLIYNDGDMYHTTLYCDKFENTTWYADYSITDRVAGTIDEQAVSVISINTTTKDVVIRRIGVGKNKTMSYSYA